jgi:molybdopterin-containing oxidoreductase family iron-sulfur binding subunit
MKDLSTIIRSSINNQKQTKMKKSSVKKAVAKKVVTKATAKKEGRTMRDGEAKVACQQSCPTDAIVFGNVNDRESNIFKIRYEEQKERVFHVLEEIHTLPNVNYLSKIRNTTVLSGAHHEEGEAHTAAKAETANHH